MTDARSTFAQRSDAYAAARPRYPAELYHWMVAHCLERRAAWDCATGNGQAAVDLAAFFDVVYASDISPEQVEHQTQRSNVRYSVEPAEQTSYPDRLFDLVTVAQALHWFDYNAFWPEVLRVSKPGALFCAWGYAWFHCDEEIDRSIVDPIRELIAPYWAENNAILWRGYRSEEVRFPFERLHPPPFSIKVEWTVSQLIAYMQTWSAYKRAQSNLPVADALDEIERRAQKSYARLPPLLIEMPLAIVSGRVPVA